MGEKKRFRVRLDNDLLAAAERRLGKSTSETLEKGLRLVVANHDRPNGAHAQPTDKQIQEKLIEFEKKLEERERLIKYLDGRVKTLSKYVEQVPQIFKAVKEIGPELTKEIEPWRSDVNTMQKKMKDMDDTMKLVIANLNELLLKSGTPGIVSIKSRTEELW